MQNLACFCTNFDPDICKSA